MTNDKVGRNNARIEGRSGMRALGRLQNTVPAPKQALLSNIFNEELSELRIVADMTTMKAKINRLLPIVSAMVGVFLGM